MKKDFYYYKFYRNPIESVSDRLHILYNDIKEEFIPIKRHVMHLDKFFFNRNCFKNNSMNIFLRKFLVKFRIK